MEAVWLEDEREFRDLAPEWDEIVRGVGNGNPFLLTDFLLTWWRHFSTERALRILGFYENGSLVGGLPLYVGLKRDKRVLRYPGAIDYEVANYTNFFTAKPVADFFVALAEALSKRRDWNVLYLDRLQISAGDLDYFTEGLEANGLMLLNIREFPTFHVDIPGSLEELLSQKKRKFRKFIRQTFRGAEREGTLQLKCMREAEAVDNLFDIYVDFSKVSYRERARKSTFEDSRLCAFFSDLFQRFGGLGILEGYALTLNEEIIAISFFYRLKNVLNFVLTSFSFAHADLNPGHLLAGQLVERAAGDGVSRINLYDAESLYKRQWSTGDEPLFRLIIGRRSMLNGARKLYYTAFDVLREIGLLRSLNASIRGKLATRG